MDGADFEPGRLRLARELQGMTQSQLSVLAGLSPAAISQFESGASRPSADTLVELGSALDVPAGFFGRPIVDTHEGFFRALRRSTVADRRRARAVAHVARELAEAAEAAGRFPRLDLPRSGVTSLDEPREGIEAIALRVRDAWGCPTGPITDVVTLLENHGVVAIRLPLKSTDVDAFSLPFPDHPVAVLGSDKADRARSRFDAAHELGHLVMHGEQIWGMKEIETQAHQFAAAFLMPAHEIRDLLPQKVDWPQLFDLKHRWQVSLAALIYRAKTLERMDDRTYLAAVKTMSARGWRRREPVPLGAPERPSLLMDFLSTPDSQGVRDYLPGNIIDSIAVANTQNTQT